MTYDEVLNSTGSYLFQKAIRGARGWLAGTPFALAALTAAYRIRKPALGTCIYHTNRGCQY